MQNQSLSHRPLQFVMPLLLSLVALLALPGEAVADASLLDLAQDQLLQAALYTQPSRMFTCRADGAVGVNGAYIDGLTTVFYIEEQRYGGEALQAAAITGDAQLMETGWSMIDIAMNQMLGPDGTFSQSADNFHSTSLFVEAVQRGILVLQATNTIGTHQADVNRALQVCANCVQWMMGPMKQTGDRRDSPYTHRRFLLAAMLLEYALLFGDESQNNFISEYLDSGMNLQFSGDLYPPYPITWTDTGLTVLINRDGVFPEEYVQGTNSGWDCDYQNVSLKYASIAWVLLSGDDNGRKPRLAAAIQRGATFEWQLETSSHTLEINGSTRDGVEVDVSGDVKTPDYTDAVCGNVYASYMTGNGACHNFAQRLAFGQGWVNQLPQ